MADDEDWTRRLTANYDRNKTVARAGPYATELTPEEEQRFGEWLAQNNVPFNPRDAVQDYDMRGFWKGLQSGDPRALTAVNPNDRQLHFPDTWKTPFHETFSADSQYATPYAPRWKADRFQVTNRGIHKGEIIFDDQAPRGNAFAPEPQNAFAK